MSSLAAKRIAQLLPRFAAVVAAGLLLLAPGVLPFSWGVSVLTSLAAGAMGLAAWWLERRGFARASRALGLLVLTGAFALAAARSEWPVDWNDGIHVTSFGPLLVAAAVWFLRPQAVGFALGAGVTVAIGWYADAIPPLVVFGFLIGRHILDSRSDAPRRLPLSLVGSGVLAVLLVTAIGFDLTALVRATFGENDMMSWAWVDGPGPFTLRVTLEVALLGSCLAMAQGRTWGVLGLAVLSWVFVQYCTGELPSMGGGCMSWPHPLEMDSRGLAVFEIAVALAVLPWAVPVLRALWSSPAQPR